MFNCTCHAFNYVVLQELSHRHDLKFLTDNLCNMHGIVSRRSSNERSKESNSYFQYSYEMCFLSYKEPDLGEAAFVARFPNKLEQC